MKSRKYPHVETLSKANCGSPMIKASFVTDLISPAMVAAIEMQLQASNIVVMGVPIPQDAAKPLSFAFHAV